MIKDLITIVIPCKNESESIGFTLSLLDKQVNIKGTKVIISDNSDDNTREVILSKKYENLNIEIIDGGLPGPARNKGANLVTTRYILFMDADVFLSDRNTVIDTLCLIMNYKLQLVTCKFRVKGFYQFVFPIFEFFRDLMSANTVFCLGGFMLFEKDKFMSVGGFDVNDKFAEDYRLSMKINPLFFYVSNNKVYTTDRRFKGKGLLYMIKMATLSMLNKNNPEFFKKDHNYWK